MKRKLDKNKVGYAIAFIVTTLKKNKKMKRKN